MTVGHIYIEKLAISSAQILALNATPLTLVAAVTGKSIIPFMLSMRYNKGDTAYTAVGPPSDPDIVVYYADYLAHGSTVCGILLAAASATMKSELNVYFDWENDDILGKALMIKLAGGAEDGDGTLDVQVWYGLL